jgi:hypothetical protein
MQFWPYFGKHTISPELDISLIPFRFWLPYITSTSPQKDDPDPFAHSGAISIFLSGGAPLPKFVFGLLGHYVALKTYLLNI